MFIELKANLKLCAKTSATKEVRFLLRALRRTTSLRKKITKEILSDFVKSYFPDNHAQKENLTNFISLVRVNWFLDALVINLYYVDY